MKNTTLFLLLIIVIPFITSCEKDEEKTGKVKYEVFCDPPGFDMIYENGAGDAIQRNVPDDNWFFSFEAKSGEFIYLSAQATHPAAEISVKVYFNDEEIESSSSSGDHPTAIAMGILP